MLLKSKVRLGFGWNCETSNMAVSCCRFAKKPQLLRCGKSWTKCFASLSSFGGKNESQSKDLKTYDEKVDTREKIRKILDDIYSQPVRNTEQEYYKTHLNPDWEGHKRSVFESRFYTKKSGVSPELKSWLYWDININDNLSINALAQRYEYIKLKEDQRYLKERTQAVGVELGAAHFTVARGGAVKFTNREVWFAKNTKGEYSLPRVFVDGLYLEAIDASNTNLTHVVFDTFEGLTKLRFMRFHNCPHIDDWCLAKLHRLKDSLEFLDISDCPVTDHGLLSLHRLKNLQCLKLSNLPKVKHLGLITILLEESNPGLSIIGLSEDDLKPPEWDHRGERRLVRALLGLMEEEEDQHMKEIGNHPNKELKRYIRAVDT